MVKVYRVHIPINFHHFFIGIEIKIYDRTDID